MMYTITRVWGVHNSWKFGTLLTFNWYDWKFLANGTATKAASHTILAPVQLFVKLMVMVYISYLGVAFSR